MKLNSDKCCLVIVDVQGKLATLMHDSEMLFRNIQILIKVFKILGIPILWCEQIPKALGRTVPQIANLLTDHTPIEKSCFSSWGDNRFNDECAALNRRQIILCGIEAHVCIYQTAMESKQKNMHVTVISDAVSSRTKENKDLAIEKMFHEGIDIASTEMVLFELMQTADHPKFKDVVKLIK